MNNSKTNQKAWYALRRTLPLNKLDELLEELIEFLPGYKVDELIVKIDTEEFWHGQPTVKMAEEYLPGLLKIKQAMKKLNIVYSLNPWITVGHGDYGRNDTTNFPDMQMMVGHDGVRSKSCACPLCDIWRHNVAEVWSIYASTKPKVMWLEDDLRTFNHKPVRLSCFCEKHMRLLSERTGSEIKRSELVNKIFAPGKAHPWRIAYFELQRDVMNSTVEFLRQIVHEVSPETHIGIMSSGPENHCAEGREWKSFKQALSNGKTIYSRTPLGSYQENNLRGIYYSAKSIKLTRHCFGRKNIVEQTEVENVPFSLYSKSSTFTFLQLAISFAYACDGVTMNLFNHLGAPMQLTPSYGKMLGKKKDFLSALKRKTILDGRYRGVQILFHEKSGNQKILKDEEFLATGNITPAHDLLESLGIATTFLDESVKITFGQTLRAFSDEEIKSMLKKSLFIDAVAAKILFKRGFGAEIGLEKISEPRPIYYDGARSAEEYFNEDFGGKAKCFTPFRATSAEPYLSTVKLDNNAQVISYLVDPDEIRHEEAFYVFKNSMGGRIAVSLYDMGNAWELSQKAFCFPYRRQMLRNVIKYLSNNKTPLTGIVDGAYPLVLRKDIDNEGILLGCFNLSLDDYPCIDFEMADIEQFSPGNILKLRSNGTWTEAKKAKFEQSEKNALKVHYSGKIKFSEPLFLFIQNSKFLNQKERI